MSNLPLDGVKPSTLLSTFKQLVFDALPWSKSGHLSEAIACGCGYNTHAAYMAGLKVGSALTLMPVSGISVDAMSDRLAKLASRDESVLRQDLSEAIVRISKSFPGDIVPVGPGSSIKNGIENIHGSSGEEVLPHQWMASAEPPYISFEDSGSPFSLTGITKLGVFRRMIDNHNGLILICGPRSADNEHLATLAALDAIRLSRTLRTRPALCVGELTSENALEQAISKSSNTLVFATLTADNATMAMGRMRNHITGYTFPNRLRDCLRGILVQRPIPKICMACAHGKEARATCDYCNGTKVSGLTRISTISEFRTSYDSSEVFWKRSDRSDHDDMIDDALDKMVAGIVTGQAIRDIYGIQADERAFARAIQMPSSPASKSILPLSGMGMTKLPELRDTMNLSTGLIIVCGPESRENDLVARLATYELNGQAHRHQPAATLRVGINSWHDLDTAISDTRQNVVFATLNADCLFTAVTKLAHMASSGNLNHKLKGCLKGILVQRSIPKICTACANRQDEIEPCLECNGLRISGSTRISTFRRFPSHMDVEDALRNLRDRHDETDMIDDALDKMVAGIVTGHAIRDIYGVRADRRALARSIQMPEGLPRYSIGFK